MIKVFFPIVTCLMINCLIAQKPVVNADVRHSWKTVSNSLISSDGRYVMYTIYKDRDYNNVEKKIIQSIHGDWKYEISGNANVLFTQDGRAALFNMGNNLRMLKLGSSVITDIPRATRCHMSAASKNPWMLYYTPEKGLVLRDLNRSEERSYPLVISHEVNKNDEVLILIMKSNHSNEKKLGWLNVADGKLTTFWQGIDPGNIVFDEDGTQVAFTGANSSIWYYKMGAEKAIELIGDQSACIEKGFALSAITDFSKDGNRLLFTVRKILNSLEPKKDAVKLNLWSYNDTILQPKQLDDLKQPGGFWNDYKMLINLQDRKIVRLEQQNESAKSLNGDYFILEYHGVGMGSSESNWNTATQRSYWLAFINGKEIKRIKQLGVQAELSPDGKYAVYFDIEQKQYFSYEIARGISRNLTAEIATQWETPYADDNGQRYPRGLAGWFTNSSAMLVYDKYDLWKIDPAGKTKPINLTNGFGRKHNIVFHLGLTWSGISDRPIANNEKVILNAFNRTNKNNGFFSKRLNRQGDPELLTMGNYVYYITNNGNLSANSANVTLPVKASNAEVYLVSRASATEFPNFYITVDLKEFTRISDIHPEKEYNWYTTELHTWKSLDGRDVQGILYKPENFDPNKKYPVIFHYYLNKSDNLNAYLLPDNLCGGCNINIPSYVSKGYLVFTPDIFITIGAIGTSVENSVVSAANYVSSLPFVNTKKMGMQGYSGGGFATSYLITHSNLFAAACAASGVYDFISGYGSLGGDGSSLSGMYETGWWRIGHTIWESPELYIKNSPILKADKITTPLLLMATSFDGVCPFPQAVELFIALRRLNKKVWMLEYEEGNHGVHGKSADDFSIRMMQFFDYYLKDEPAPKWMIQGRPAHLKGIDERLELIPKEVKPDLGLNH